MAEVVQVGEEDEEEKGGENEAAARGGEPGEARGGLVIEGEGRGDGH